MTGRLFTCRQVADQLGVAPGTLLRWTRNGAIPAIRLPSGALRYSEVVLDEWLAARATATLSPTSSAPATLERPGAWPQGDQSE